MRQLLCCAALAAVLFTPKGALAQSANEPMVTGDVCIVDLDNTSGGKTVAAWCGVSDTKVGKSGFFLINDTTTVVCLSGTGTANMTTTAGGKCIPICNAAACNFRKSFGVKGTIHKWKVVSGGTVTVSFLFGSAP